MKAVIKSSAILLKLIRRDNTTALFFVLPIVIAFVIRFGIPALMALLETRFGIVVSLTEYYSLADLIMIMMTPFFFGFGASMLVLEEMDEHILPSYWASPLGRRGYLISRLIIPIALSLIVTLTLVSLLQSGTQGFMLNLTLSGEAALFCLIPFFLIIVLAKNKVEGMVFAKFSTVLLLCIFIPYFITDWVQYIFGFIPSFWIAKLAMTTNYIYVIPFIVSSGIWLWLLHKAFERKTAR